MTEIDVFGNVIRKTPLKEVVESKNKVIEEVVTPDSSLIIDKIPTVEESSIITEDQPKKKGRKKKVITE